MEIVAVIAIFFAFPVALGVAGYVFVIRPMQREAREQLDQFAKSLRRMRDESREAGVDFKPTAKLAKSMLERS